MPAALPADPDAGCGNNLQHLSGLPDACGYSWLGHVVRGINPLAFALNSVQTPSMRKVLKSDLRPIEIKPQEKSVWICMCGLSKNQPFCDGSHKSILEEEGKVYEYDAQGHRVEI